MKKILLALLFIGMALACFGAPPRLASETIFDRKEIKTEGHEFMSTKSESNYFRSVTAYNDKKLTKEIKEQVLKDKSRASNTVEGWDNGKEYIILNIPHNGYIINVGFWWDNKGYCNLFVQSQLGAFE